MSSEQSPPEHTPTATPPVPALARRWHWSLAIAMAFAGLIVGSSAGIVTLMMDVAPEIHQLSDYRPALTTRVYAEDDSLFTEFAAEKRVLLPLSAIPPQLQEAFLAFEDTEFYDHFGVSPKHILRVAILNIRSGKIRGGGSTITQQLSKILFLTPEQTLSRKIREAILSLQIERLFSKDEILEMYLNQIYLGSSYNGVGMAARGYFNKDVSELTLAECAMLAALPKSPNRYSPRNNMERAIRRRNIVLLRMRELQWIGEQEFEQAKNEPITLSQPEDTKAEGGYFGEHVRQKIHSEYGYEKLYKSGLRVKTTINPVLQAAADKAIADGLVRLEQRRADEYDAKRMRELRRIARKRQMEYEDLSRAALEEELGDEALPAAEEFAQIQAALVLIETRTGAIRAMVGGRDFIESEFNRGTQARRQMGSIFKPMVWAAAFERGWTPADRIIDSPIIYHYERDGEVQEWTPENYEERFFGPTTLREALEHSRNIVAIKLLNEVGIGNTVRLARRMGITSYLDRNLSLALGSSGATLLEVAGAYSAFANQGVAIKPYAIESITGADGDLLYEHQPGERIAMSEEAAYLVTSVLNGVTVRGTAERHLREFPWTVAGKTGTTDDCTDAWFVGYSPEYVCGVWVGYDRVQPLGKRWTGGQVALPIWRDMMEHALAGQPITDFVAPPNITFKNIDRQSGLLAPTELAEKYVIREAFVRGSEPDEVYQPGAPKTDTVYQPLHLYESNRYTSSL